MDIEDINKLISKDRLREAIDILYKEKLYRNRLRLLKLIRGRLINLKKENMEGILDPESYTLRRNRIRKDLIEFIDFNLQDRLPIEFIKTTLQESDLRMKGQEIDFSEKVKHKKFLAELGRQYDWSVKLPVEIENQDIEVKFNPLSKEIDILISKIWFSPNYSITNHSSETIEEETRLWSEEIARDGKFWQEVNEITQEKLNNKIRNDHVFVKGLYDNAVERILDKISKVISAEEIGDSKINIKIQHIEGYNGYKRQL